MSKDNQEAELLDPAREAFLDKYLTLANHLKVGTLDAIRLMVEVESYCATLTTPQVNEEVASGEVYAWYRQTSPLFPGSQEVREGVFIEFRVSTPPKGRGWLPLYTTPSPSNVLVEALQEINNWLVCWPIATPEDMAQSFEHMNNVATNALATYSASTDSVSISKSEYEALEEYDDGSKVVIDSYAGGAHVNGAWSELSLLFIDKDGNESRKYYVEIDAPETPTIDTARKSS